MKRILTIQDFSCVGKCSLSVALSVIAAAGMEACGLPAALLSNHTGFSSFYLKDLTDEIKPVIEQLKNLGIKFDAVYTGYVPSVGQIDILTDELRFFGKEGAVIFVDPAMGDDGRLYSGLSEDFPEHMRKLCAAADVISPNLTECSMLIGRECGDIKEALYELLNLGAEKAVITGIERDGLIGAVGYDGLEFSEYFTPRVPLKSAGTGDVFSAALISALTKGGSFGKAIEIAVKFTHEAVRLTKAANDRRFYGVNFEDAIPYFIELTKNNLEN